MRCDFLGWCKSQRDVPPTVFEQGHGDNATGWTEELTKGLCCKGCGQLDLCLGKKSTKLSSVDVCQKCINIHTKVQYIH